MAYLQISLMSQCLMRTVNVNVILPADQAEARQKPFRTLYLLHGIFGSQFDWVNGTNIQRWAVEKGLAVVMPAGENMFYLDQPGPGNYYGEFVGRELVDLTRRMLPLSHQRQDTFIAGLSMGGYGALRNGLKYADTFGGIAGLSTANIVEGIESRPDDAPRHYMTRAFAQAVFGDLSKVKNSDQDIAWLAQQRAASGKPLPRVYMACGLDDGLLPGNRRLRDTLQALGFDVTWEEGPGSHEWDFWNRHIKRVVDWIEAPALKTPAE